MLKVCLNSLRTTRFLGHKKTTQQLLQDNFNKSGYENSGRLAPVPKAERVI